MSSIDLNIIERGLKSQEWTAEKGPITSADLAKVSEQRTNSSSALNALPTPFARFFVVKEAFRRALEELKNSKKVAGNAYNRLVSDTLDVFELLYNLRFHKSRWGEDVKIIIREWDKASDLLSLKTQVPILGNAVENYISDLKSEQNRLFFVVLRKDGRDYLLATSSPFTGFITPPDLDKKVNAKNNDSIEFLGSRYKQLPHIPRKSGGYYFRDTKMFGDRSKEFKNYLHHLVDNSILGDEMREFRDYIKQVAVTDHEINRNWVPQTAAIISENNSEIKVNGLPVMQDCGISTVNFFTDTLIRLPFRLSDKFYQGMTIVCEDSENRDFDFLLPISQEGLNCLNKTFECTCQVNKTKTVVKLKYKGQEYTKDYSLNPEGFSNRGQIIDLTRENINFNLGIFPNILSPNAVENNYFKVMSVVNDSTEDFTPFSIKKLNLSFYFENEGKFVEIEPIDGDNDAAVFGVRPAVIRSNQNTENEISASSKLYEIFNHQFDAISLKMALSDGFCEGVILPKWTIAQRTRETYKYAVDLGTTNTYISSCKNGLDHEPEQLSMSEPMVAYLHDVKKSRQHSLISLIESGINEKCRKNFNTEFVPALIDGTTYKFPIRTALCVPTGDKSNPSLFDNCNIAFFYEKTTSLGNQTVLTDIKWEGANEKHLRIFIRELLLLIKSDILQKNGLLADTHLIWFRPLSFKGTVREFYTKVWKEEAKNVLNISENQIECISESEAPYYYFKRMNQFQSIDSVSIVDIGGGSSDFIYFADGKPQIANSIHFGCDVLWGNGFVEFENNRSNGIYNKYKETIHFDDEELEAVNLRMNASKTASTKDIINFWLGNDDKCEFTKRLKETYKPLFLYHFASLVFFMAQMYKVKGLAAPRAVVFCGNGSKYIDGLISSDSSIITSIVTRIFKEVYGNDILGIQVILPQQRKESTCYGGLYRNSDVEIPEEFNFQGLTDKEYENVAELKKDFDSIKIGLLGAFDKFNKLYEDLLNILLRSKDIEKLSNADDIKQAIATGLSDSLTKNFKTQIAEPFSDSEVYHDSIFFLPIIDNILKLTQI